MKRLQAPGLDDLAFEGRNKAYGAYYLRRNYWRHLLFSLIIGLILMGSAVIVPFLIYYFTPVPLMEMDLMYEVEYYSMMEPPEEDMNDIAQALAKPLPEVVQVPVVKDSIRPEEEMKPVETPPQQEPEVNEIDSAGNGQNGSEIGEGVGENSGITTIIDVYPRFPGGNEARLYYLRKNTSYPEQAVKSKIQGVVMVVFIVETDGSISGVEISKGIGGGCDEEAIRVTKAMPQWEPGKRGGRKVRVIVRMPIVFMLPGKSA